MAKYLIEFKDLNEAKARGAAGLLNPNVNYIKGKNAVNMADANCGKFTCDFSDEGKMKDIIPVVPSNNEIWYTSTDGNIITPYTSGTEVFGANIVSNTYENDKGIIKFDGAVISIGYMAFFALYEATSRLINIIIPYSVTSIGDYAFDGCTSLSSITIPNSVTSIGQCAFLYCTSLSNAIIGSGVTSIGNCVFSSCYSLNNIIIPNSVLTIENDAFVNCYSLINVTIPNNIISIGENAFSGCYFARANFINNSSYITGYPWGASLYDIEENGLFINGTTLSRGRKWLTNVKIPNFITSIGDYAFSSCKFLNNIVIPNSVTNIGCEAFWECTSLSNIVIPNSVTNIGGAAFAFCTNLSSITIGSGVINIEGSAFRNCTVLMSFTSQAITPPILPAQFDYVFYNVPETMPIYVPSDSVEAYKIADGWSTRANYIQAILQ